MIPTIQMISNSSNMLSSIHKDVLDKFALSITPIPSPISNTEADEEESVDELQSIDQSTLSFETEQNDEPQKFIDHEDVFNYCNELKFISNGRTDGTVESVLTNGNGIRKIDRETSNCDDNNTVVNYTIIGNGLIVIDGAEIEIDEETYDSNKEDQYDMQFIEDVDSMLENTIENEQDTNDTSNDKKTEDDFNKNHIESASNNKDEYDQISKVETTTKPNISNICNGNRIKLDDEDSSSEHELTNLGWLIDLKNLTHWPTDTTISNRKNSNGKLNPATTNNIISNCIIDDIDENDGCIESIVSDKDLSEERFRKFTIQVKQSQKNYAERETIYKMDPFEKPPFNYAQIIAMAMMDCGRMTLKDICKWIQEHFAYFRYNKNWNNSIRHNLSLHFCFTKIARDKTEKGKGGYWELSMNATKSEKKRIRNRRKHRDESGRFSYSLRNGRTSRKNCQKQGSTNEERSTESQSSKCFNSTQNSKNYDSCNVSMGSDASSSMCSANGMNEETTNMWSELSNVQNSNLLSLAQNTVTNEQVTITNDQIEEHLNDVGTNDFVIINGVILNRANSEIIKCNFDKNEDRIVDNYILDQIELKQQQQQNAMSIQNIILNDASNEIFIKNDLNQHLNSLNGTTIMATAAVSSNVIVEPMPYCLSHMDTVIDIEHEFSNLVNIPDPELAEDNFFDYSSW